LQVLNVLLFLKSPTGQATLRQPLPAADLDSLQAMLAQLRILKRQQSAEAAATAQPHRSPAELQKDGLWVRHDVLQGATRDAAEALLGRQARMMELSPASLAAIEYAREIKDSALMLLLSALAPQRPKQFYSMRVGGVEGLETRGPRAPRLQPLVGCHPQCSLCEAPGCLGNTLVRAALMQNRAHRRWCTYLNMLRGVWQVRDAERQFTWWNTHHKNENCGGHIPVQRLNAENHSCPVMLRMLEVVFVWGHVTELRGFNEQLDVVDAATAFRDTRGTHVRNSQQMSTKVSILCGSILRDSGNDGTKICATTIRHMYEPAASATLSL
jgi:hypothetical protein